MPGVLAQSSQVVTEPRGSSRSADGPRAWVRGWPLGARATVIALIVLAAALRFGGLDQQGFWYDEGVTVSLVHRSLWGMLSVLPQTESTPPLYYVLAWGWARMFGFSELGLRSLSAIAGVATVPAAYAAARELGTHRIGVIAASLTACSPFLIWYSQETRAYALLTLLSALSVLCFARARTRPTTGRLLAWVAVCALAVLTHYFAVFLIAAEGVLLVLAHRRTRRVYGACAALAGIGLAMLPLVEQEGNHAGWITWIPLGSRLSEIPHHFLIGFYSPARGLLMIALILLGVAITLAILRGDRRERRTFAIAGGLFLLGFVLAVMAAVTFTDTIISRNLIELWIPACIAVAAGLGVKRSSSLILVPAVALCATMVAASVLIEAEPRLQRVDWRPLARALDRMPALSGRAVLIQDYPWALPLTLYLPSARAIPKNGVWVRELDVVAIDARYSLDCWWGAQCSLRPSTLQDSYPIGGFTVAGQSRVAQFTILRLIAPSPHRLTPASVARALTGRTLTPDALLAQPAS